MATHIDPSAYSAGRVSDFHASLPPFGTAQPGSDLTYTHNLPNPVSRFIRRESELLEVRRLLSTEESFIDFFKVLTLATI